MSDKTNAGMSRRKLLETAGSAAAAVAAGTLTGPAGGAATPQSEADIIDERLTRKVTLAFKATALADLCEQLHRDTGIRIAAGPSVADEKVTLFCEKLPLREVMRQLSRPFGYTWLRSGTPGQYRYELVQDLRSQLLEEELRNRDSNAALLALEHEIERYRPYLDLSPDEALARAKEASPADKELLEQFAGYAWGAIQMYSRLSSQELATLRACQSLIFSAAPQPGEQPLPAETARRATQVFRDWYVYPREGGYTSGPEPDRTVPGAVSVSAIPDARARIKLSIVQSELGRTTLLAEIGWSVVDPAGQPRGGGNWGNYVAAGMSPAALRPENAIVNARLAHDPALRLPISLEPRPSCPPAERPDPGDERKDQEDVPHSALAPQPSTEPKVNTADVLEALHRAAGIPIIADYYTRLYKLGSVTVKNQPLFEALNQLADTMRLRWHKEAGTREASAWLQFRSVSYYDDRLKEVPNRLLARWVAARQRQAGGGAKRGEQERSDARGRDGVGGLMLDDLVEIAQLSDAQLDASDMAAGARDCFGLTEWDLGCSSNYRPHLRFLAGFTPAQRQVAMRAEGLPFTQMSLAQQQAFLPFVLPANAEPLQSLDELAGATLRVEYTQPGWFQWGEPCERSILRWVVPLEPGRQGLRVLRPPVRERSREAALQAVRRIDPKIREALARAMRRIDPRLETAPHVVEEDQIFPTKLDLAFIYFPGPRNGRAIRVRERESNDDYQVHFQE